MLSHTRRGIFIEWDCMPQAWLLTDKCHILPYTDEYSGVPSALNLAISDVHRYDNGAGSTERV